MLRPVASPSVYVYRTPTALTFRRNDQKPAHGATLAAVVTVSIASVDTLVLDSGGITADVEQAAVEWLEQDLNGPNRAHALAASGYRTIPEQRLHTSAHQFQSYAFTKLTGLDRGLLTHPVGFGGTLVATAAIAHRAELAGANTVTLITPATHRGLAQQTWRRAGVAGHIHLNVVTPELAARRTDWVTQSDYLLVDLSRPDSVLQLAARATQTMRAIRAAIDSTPVVYVAQTGSQSATCQVRDLDEVLALAAALPRDR